MGWLVMRFPHPIRNGGRQSLLPAPDNVKVLACTIPAAYRERKCMERWTLIDLNGAHYKLVLFDV